MSHYKNDRNFYKRYSLFCGRNCIKMILAPANISQSVLNLNVNRMDINNWIAFFECLPYDKMLTKISIKSTRDIPFQLSDIDSLKKVKKLPIEITTISTQYMMKRLTRCVSTCLHQTERLTHLALEGLPISQENIAVLMEGISNNKSLQYLSFQRSKIKNTGFIAICRSITYLSNIERLNVSRCELNFDSIDSFTALIKAQCVFRFSEAWKHSLRYRNIDVNEIRGLKFISMNENPLIGDEGVQKILDALIDDVWIEKIELRDCGISDNSGKLILSLLEKKFSKLNIDVSKNEAIAKTLLSRIQFSSFAATSEEKSCSQQTKRKLKEEISQLKSELQLGISLRHQSDRICMDLKEKLSKHEQNVIPDGYSLIKTEILERLQERLREIECSKLNHSVLLNRSKFPFVNSSKTIYTKKVQKEATASNYELIGDFEDVDIFQDDVNSIFLGMSSPVLTPRSEVTSSDTSEFVSSFSSF